MGKEELINCFQDTIRRAGTGQLAQKTSQAIASNKIYKEGFISNVPKGCESSSVIVEVDTSFDSAKRYSSIGKVAVLNFANPEYPGGGVAVGAIAQEECLCRSSNLYLCISDQNVFDEYYAYHRSCKNCFYSDRLIYTAGVTAFKDDELVPRVLPENEWFDVDVITCAAPCLAQRKYTNLAALFSLFKSRIKNIFEAARDNEVSVIILGAFGCGAFKNPPYIVAEAFRQVICEQNYFADFRQIVFAIKPTGEHCPNLSAFAGLFDIYAPDADMRCAILPMPIKWRYHRVPTLFVGACLYESQEFHTWQEDNRYYGKQFSILGDSISTLEGYNPKGYKVFYSGDNCIKSFVLQMADTWWDKVISFFGGELLVNNSWSGSKVTKSAEQSQLFPSGCSDERTSSLHINDVKPDVILVFLGTNDWAFGAKTGNETNIPGEDNNEIFESAYHNMLLKLIRNYPQSEIWCCTLSETIISANPDFRFPHKYAGTHIDVYNEIIRKMAWKNKCRIIDLCNYKIPYDSIDGFHPTDCGMETIARIVIREMAGQEADAFLDCTDRQQESVMQNPNITWEQVESAYAGQQESVMQNPDITEIPYPNILCLTVRSTGKTVQIRKSVVTVGRGKMCDFLLAGKATVSRLHATFFYEHGMWFLRDDFSKNGTWINGVKIQPGKKYQLAANDEIIFAMAEKVTFYQDNVLIKKKGVLDKLFGK